MTDAAKAVVWKAVYEPFGTVYSTTGAAAQNMRFPGQWFQIESNLAYNWHRHYDATLGRYISADPLNHALNGAPVTATLAGLASPGQTLALHLDWLLAGRLPSRSTNLGANPLTGQFAWSGLFPDGANLYGYAGQSSWMKSDPTGLNPALLGSAIGATTSACMRNPFCASAVFGLSQKIVEACSDFFMGRKSEKEKSADVPSWIKGKSPKAGESGKEFADRVLGEKYGKGNFDKGPGSEHSKVKKWIDRR